MHILTKSLVLCLSLLTVCSGQSIAQSTATAQELFKTYFNPTPVRAMDSYPSRYDVSNPVFLRLKKDSINLYTGIRLLEANKPQQAIPHLQRAASNMGHTVSNVSEWYLALAYLKSGKISEAEYMFYKIAETEVHPHQDDAEVIYQRLLRQK